MEDAFCSRRSCPPEPMRVPLAWCSVLHGRDGGRDTPERRRPGGCSGLCSHCSLPARLASHFSSRSADSSIIAASASDSAQVPTFVRTPAACDGVETDMWVVGCETMVL